MEGNEDCMKKRTISPLPRGMGSMALTKDGTIEYKRVLKLKNGEKTRKTVHGNTQLECMKKMEELEKELNTNNKPKNKQTLVEAMYEWMELKKRPILKEQAYKREIGTIKNQIGRSRIGHYRYQTIKPEEIQAVLNDLNNKEYSYSVIKKTYDSLNAFYRYVSVRDKFDNPMLLVEVWKKKNVNAEEKQIAYYDEEDIHKFVRTAGERYKTGKLRYETGYALAANLYMGLRVGDDDDKIRLNQRKPSKYKGLRRFGPEKNLQRINKFMKERPIFYKNLIQMKENIRFYLRCFYCITKVMILQFNSENRTELARNG